MPSVRKKDFIEVEYTGRLKQGDIVFDTTDESLAKKANIFSKRMAYGPIIVCLGEGQLLKGLEKELEGKEAGKEYKICLSPEDAFGKKDAKLIKMIPAAAFRKQNIIPEPGMQVNIDGVLGIIKTASGGRCLVDFNHPLSGKDVVYDVKIKRIVTDDKEKIKSYLALMFNNKDVNVELKDGKAEVMVKNDLPAEIQESIKNDVKRLVPSVKDLLFKKEVTQKR